MTLWSGTLQHGCWRPPGQLPNNRLGELTAFVPVRHYSDIGALGVTIEELASCT